jgi:hypoxanthine phosphoribosyltransferase
VQVSSYGDETSSSGVVRITKDLDISIEGRDVLLVEDILDSGLTLCHLRELLATRHPRSLRVVTLLRKPGAQRFGAQAEYVGFDIPESFVVGYGLDHAQRYRNLPYIAVLHEV